MSPGDVGGALLPSDLPSNCVLVRKVLVTATRCVYLPPEVLMANRVVRKFGAESALRVCFRDDAGNRLIPTMFRPMGRSYEPEPPNTGIY